MTVEPGYPVLTDNPQASLRLELLGQIVAAQFELEAALPELTRGGGSTAIVQSQLQALSALQRQIGKASPAALAAMRADVTAMVTQAQSTTHLARVAASGTDAAELVAHHAAESRQQVRAILRNLHQFDDQLRFTSPDDERAYRQREADRLAYIEAEQRKGTPQGDLAAAGGTLAQLADAKAFGAGDSPEFKAQWDRLVTTTEKLRDAARARGIPTDEFDQRLRDDLRRILNAKGLSDAQIDAHFAANPDPLEAVKAFVRGEDDIGAIDRTVSRVADRAAAVLPIVTATTVPAMTLPIDDAMAEFRAAGIATAELPPGGQFDPGIAAKGQAIPGSGRSGITAR